MNTRRILEGEINPEIERHSIGFVSAKFDDNQSINAPLLAQSQFERKMRSIDSMMWGSLNIRHFNAYHKSKRLFCCCADAARSPNLPRSEFLMFPPIVCRRT